VPTSQPSIKLQLSLRKINPQLGILNYRFKASIKFTRLFLKVLYTPNQFKEVITGHKNDKRGREYDHRNIG
jgi:hypothetical protein